MQTFTAKRATAGLRHLLAEGPLWDPVRERVLWIDSDRGEVYLGVLTGDDRVEPAGRLSFPGESVGAVVVAEDGALLVALRRRLMTVLPGGQRTPGIQLLPDGVGSRLNDGGCDPLGQFVVGSMALDGRAGQESLWRLPTGGPVQTLDTDLSLSNGLAWSPDGRTMYSIDTTPGVVWARSFDPSTGRTGSRYELFAPLPGAGDDGPDGVCVDVEGNLWIAVWGSGQVRCCTPSGEVLAVVEVDAPHTASVAFVGPRRDLLLITTASGDLSADQLAAHPDSGQLFTARVGTRGLPVPYWVGPT